MIKSLQLLLYAQNSDNLQLEEVEFSREARGYAFRVGRHQSRLPLILLNIINVLMNVVFALAATYFLQKYQNYLNELQDGKKYQLVASMYWSIVFLCFISAIVIIAGNCYLYSPLLVLDDDNDTFITFPFRVVSDITVAILAIGELVASLWTQHNANFFIPYAIRVILKCFHCYGSEDWLNTLRHIALSVAMWIIILFLQLLVSSIIPLVVVTIVNPVPSLAFVAILATLFFCLVIFVAYIMNAVEGNYILNHSKHKYPKWEGSDSSLRKWFKSKWSTLTSQCLLLFVQAIAFLLISIIFFLGVLLYLVFVRAGGDTNNVSGLIVSFVPSAILAGITWAAKKHLFKELEEEEEEEEDEEESKTAAKVTKHIFQFGGLSLQHQSTRRKKKAMIKEGHGLSSAEKGASVSGGEDVESSAVVIAQGEIDDGKGDTGSAVASL